MKSYILEADAITWDIGALRDPDKIIPSGPEFLRPESLKSIHHAMVQAERLGLELGLFASSSWNVPLKEILTGMGVERDFVPEGIDYSDQ